MAKQKLYVVTTRSGDGKHIRRTELLAADEDDARQVVEIQERDLSPDDAKARYKVESVETA